MAEVGARPKVSAGRRRALNAMRSLFTPLLPDDYLELVNPLWSTQELRGRVDTAVYITSKREVTLRDDVFSGALRLVDAILSARQAA